MAEHLRPIDIHSNPDLPTLVETVRRTKQALPLTADGKDVAVLMPARPARRPRKGQPTTADDPIWDIVGMVQSDGPGDVAEQHDQYLADAYLDPHECAALRLASVLVWPSWIPEHTLPWRIAARHVTPLPWRFRPA